MWQVADGCRTKLGCYAHATSAVKKMQRLRHALLVSVFFLTVSVANAEIPQPDAQYGSGTMIEYPQRGISYVLPPNVYGITSPNNPESEMIVGVAPYVKDGDNTLYIQVGAANFDAVADEMSRVVVFYGTQLQPVSQPSVVDGAVYNDFQYMENGKHYSAFMLMVVAENGSAVMFVASSSPEKMQAYKNAIVELAKSIKVSAPAITEKSKQAGAQASQRPTISQSQNGSVVMGAECSYVSAGGMTMKVCD